ncbi:MULTISPECIES: Abi family protein [Microbacterium]|uniref:Abi family protein n=1 Tax=Microbacterium TaxID=33882 RepID=UPI0015C8522F|nr:Abi family protein [Microbacterium sp. JAI119]NYF29268.1 abortive infection bacteriophage resistance protein [Microbacterium sp. JAI119]
MTHDSSYAKPFKTVREQVALLASRGMDVGDQETAETLLSRIGYYRLSGYWYPYREREIDGVGNTIVKSSVRPGTTLAHVCSVYDFDRELRASLFDALEAVEVALRFQVGHTLGRRDVFAHRQPTALDPGFVLAPAQAESGETTHSGVGAQGDAKTDPVEQVPSKTRHQEWLERFDDQERRSQEAFATHFRSKYGPHLPVWVATEVMSFGTLAQLYGGAAQDDRERIAASLDLIGKDGKGDATLLSNWLNHIRYIRNLCAHHSRMWNRSFDVELASAAHIPDLAHLASKSQRRLYGTISVLTFLLARVAPAADWRTRIQPFIQSRTDKLGLDLDALGFPPGWETADMWRENYQRDPKVAQRVSLLADLNLASTSTMRELLHSREPKERRSWLNYLRSRHALVWVTMGEAKLFPSFQLDHDSGNIHSVVGDINADFYAHLTTDGAEAEDARWQILEWWTTSPSASADTPVEQLRKGTLTLEGAQSTYL